MKKTLFLLFMAVFVLMGIGAAAEANLTLLVYMCGANLQEAGCYDIYEMGMAETGDEVNIVVLAGGASEWAFDEIAGNTRNLITIRNGEFESITDWGWASMGSGESLLEFLEYGLSEYPADRTAVILWDHGAGSEAGICFDDTTQEQDGLSLVEINDVLYDLNERLNGFHIDLFGCDACMMATYEMAAMLSYYDIDYFVASEELEPGLGWSYTPWLKAVSKDPGMTTEALCERIVDSYMEASQEAEPDSYLTLSAIDLGEMEGLQSAMEDLGAVLLNEMAQGNAADVRRGRSRMYTFGAYADGSWDMVDLGAMLDAYAQFAPDGAAQARKAMGQAVRINRQSDNLDPCCGLSVLIPQDTKDEFESYIEGLDLSFYMPNWMGFVKAYAGQLVGGSHSFAQTTPQAVTGSGFFSQISAMIGESTNEMNWDEATQTYEEASQPTDVVATTEYDYAFSASIAPEDLQYLDHVEGMLMMDISDEEMFGYVDLGLMQNNVVDWNSGEVYSLFDGTWPIFGDQLVPLYDQLKNEYGRRSLIPVRLNGEYTYLVVEFKAGEAEGRILGANAGYDANGLPIRNTTELNEGDSIIPVYTMFVDSGDDGELQEMEFDGDEILWEDGMTVTYEDLGEDDDKLEMMFCFVLNDVFGEYDMTEAIPFEV
ncbi:MAG: hypothetical protein IJI71_05930 [Clostridia bacterium]|nr:hypothetical protein [Clostridia bacterium]